MICAMPTRMYCAGCTRFPVVTSKMKYARNTSPRNSGTYLSERLTDWYGLATSTNETPMEVAARPVIESAGPSAHTPRAMNGTVHSAEKPLGVTVRLTGRKPPSKPGLGQSPCSVTWVVFPQASTLMRCAPEKCSIDETLNCALEAARSGT